MTRFSQWAGSITAVVAVLGVGAYGQDKLRTLEETKQIAEENTESISRLVDLQEKQALKAVLAEEEAENARLRQMLEELREELRETEDDI